jgi:hypothetical protein
MQLQQGNGGTNPATPLIGVSGKENNDESKDVDDVVQRTSPHLAELCAERSA